VRPARARGGVGRARGPIKPVCDLSFAADQNSSNSAIAIATLADPLRSSADGKVRGGVHKRRGYAAYRANEDRNSRNADSIAELPPAPSQGARGDELMRRCKRSETVSSRVIGISANRFDHETGRDSARILAASLSSRSCSRGFGTARPRPASKSRGRSPIARRCDRITDRRSARAHAAIIASTRFALNAGRDEDPRSLAGYSNISRRIPRE